MGTQETAIYTAVVISALVIGAIIILFMIAILRQQRRNLELSRKNILAEITAMERERSRIANDLHDDISPVLSVVKFQINSLQLTREQDVQQVASASEYLDQLIERMRVISNNLTPASLQSRGLLASLQHHIGNLAYTTRLKIHFTHDALPELSPDLSINLYRIIQETLHNAIKHAGASELKLSVEWKKDQLAVLCIDNGRGFDYEAALARSTGFGLRSLKSRAELMGGSLRVESKPGKGTAFLYQIPIH